MSLSCSIYGCSVNQIDYVRISQHDWRCKQCGKQVEHFLAIGFESEFGKENERMNTYKQHVITPQQVKSRLENIDPDQTTTMLIKKINDRLSTVSPKEVINNAIEFETMFKLSEETQSKILTHYQNAGWKVTCSEQFRPSKATNTDSFISYMPHMELKLVFTFELP